MKKELFLRIIISVLILINLATVLSYINIRGELKLSQTKKLDCQSYKEALSSNLSNVQMNSNIKIDQNISITDSYESKIILKNLFKSGPKLIVYNSETGCSLCIEKELEIIKNISTKIGVKNIIIISNFNNSRKLEVFKNTYNLEFDVFHCKSLKLPFEKVSSQPCVFVIDSELIVKDFFVPDRTLPELSEKYYLSVYDKYFRLSNNRETHQTTGL